MESSGHRDTVNLASAPMTDLSKRSFLGTPATAPGPDGPDMLRAFGQIRGNPLAYLEQTWHEFGDVVQFPVPRPPSYLVVDPAGVRHVLVGNARNYGKSTIQYKALSLVTGDGLLTSDTDEARLQRPMVQPAFHHRTLQAVAGHVAAAVDRVSADWERQIARGVESAVIDVDESMMLAALEVVGHALFGTDLSEDADRLARATLQALDVVIARARVPITPPQWIPTVGNVRLRKANAELDRAVRAMTSVRMSRTSEPDQPDMLDLLLGVKDDHGQALSQEEIRDQMVTFIVAGHETVASALTWSWALLAAHPTWQQALQVEADAVLGDRLPSIDDYEHLPVARAVQDEALRLYPPAWLITRKARSSDVLGGRPIPAGSLVIMSPWLLHRHQQVWSDPELFDPGRFLDGRAERSAFIPFGAGPRLCIGRDFALVEGALMLAGLARKFQLSYPEGASLPQAEPLVTIRPQAGLPLVIQRR